jgi:hypothetical protein
MQQIRFSFEAEFELREALEVLGMRAAFGSKR